MCSSPAELVALDATLKARITADTGSSVDALCAKCIGKFAKKKKKLGGQKKSLMKSKEQNRLDLWRSRVTLIKEARERFAKKNYPNAVVAYEKYLRVLEIIYEVGNNGLDVKPFNNPARAKEMTVIASAYFDLVRIYDNSKQYRQRLEQCGQKLAMFLPYTPLCGEIVNKLEDFRRGAQNKDIFDKIIKATRKKKGRCFIATAAFEDAEDPIVQVLSRYRDQILKPTAFGRSFVFYYYKFSPIIADILDRSFVLRLLSRTILTQLAFVLEKKYNLKSR